MPFAEPPGFYATVGAVLTPAVEQRFSTTAPNGTSISTTSAIGAGLGSEAGMGYDFGKARAEITAIYNPRSINSTTAQQLICLWAQQPFNSMMSPSKRRA